MKRKWKIRRFNEKLIVFISIVILLQGCAYWIRYDGPYKGRVIDEKSGKPIEGVVVLGVWYTAMWTPAGETHHFSDATETVTDEKGDFEIKGKGLRILSNLEPMNVLIFKTGYNYIGLGPWISFKKSSYYREKIKWEEDRAIIPLRKLTMAERRNNIPLSPPIEASLEKIILMLKEMNKNAQELGYQPIDKWRGSKL